MMLMMTMMIMGMMINGQDDTDAEDIMFISVLLSKPFKKGDKELYTVQILSSCVQI